ncbi:MAG TPA: aminotransferase class I/II-fold pyridoxal phosphate-dependent enzyme, partial [Bacteroidales bacterium]|nr:aminotransferase class I/II-fold pyridoxal phosphate-dependent enzyme [Bacteroidales bacterium]
SGMYKPLQMAAAQALSCNEDWFNRINDEYKRRRELVWKIFEATGSTYDKRQSGLFVWAKIPQDYENSTSFSNKYLYESNVFIAPGFIFGTNGEGFARISLCCNIETLNEALNRIKKK